MMAVSGDSHSGTLAGNASGTRAAASTAASSLMAMTSACRSRSVPIKTSASAASRPDGAMTMAGKPGSSMASGPWRKSALLYGSTMV